MTTSPACTLMGAVVSMMACFVTIDKPSNKMLELLPGDDITSIIIWGAGLRSNVPNHGHVSQRVDRLRRHSQPLQLGTGAIRLPAVVAAQVWSHPDPYIHTLG